ncbi:type II toxin-antitoxin system ParD family antitoxin [Rhizobium sp. RU36D]|uniref:type II toxin-antitoxin system ParD family antitoxin n=1 Tax=Rhizobium sp. RU36D TaxID=1907415 RepID=UPI0009D8E629|nr:type II toxin-antitoxin system ParD family antitoxin [Rhizobium sp. RU36D]SMD07251.1 antitoxin ParD1/3/4 [Rhizobium sp. RU36D]
MNIQLSSEDMTFVENLVEAGVYKNVDEVVATALRLLGSNEGKFVELQRLIQEGVDDIEAGRVLEFDSADQLTAHILEMAEEQKNAKAPVGDLAKGTKRSARNS